jgi:hypothetical protein
LFGDIYYISNFERMIEAIIGKQDTKKETAGNQNI